MENYCLRSSSPAPDAGGGGRAALLLPGMDLYSVKIVISSPFISSTYSVGRQGKARQGKEPTSKNVALGHTGFTREAL